MALEPVPLLSRRIRHDEKGFTLLELVIVMMILAILMTVGVVSYVGFRDHAHVAVAKSNVRAIMPAIESYNADNRGYDNMTLDLLKTNYDQAIDLAKYSLSGVTATSFCISSTSAGQTFRKVGPSGTIVAGPPC
jgi:prepilin-type N-terminal cleavage/methylation domain-containing protein